MVIVAKMRCNRQLIALAILAGLFMCATAEDAAAKRGPKITTKVFFDIEIDGKEAGTCHFALQLMVDETGIMQPTLKFPSISLLQAEL